MTQEQFEALGIDRTLAKKAAEESAKELNDYVKKESYDQLDQEKKQLETSVADHKKQLEDLKKTAGDNAALTQQIADFQTQMQQKEADHQKEIKDLKLTSAIKMAVAASAQDGDLVAGLIARDKLILGDDGKVTGLDEQVKALKESKPFLFKQEEKPNPKRGFFPLGGKQLEDLKKTAGDNAALTQQIADFQTQMQQKEADHQKEIKDLKLTSAIKMAVAASAQDGDLVAGLIARDKLILGDDGKVTGLDEQVKALKESKPFLFKQEEKPNPKRGFFPLGGKQPDGGKDGNEGHMTMKEAIAAKLNLGAEGKE